MAGRSSSKSSKVVTQKSWALLKSNPFLFAFPVIDVVLATIPLAVFGVPALVLLDATVVADITTSVVGFLVIMLGTVIISAMRGIYSVALYYYAKEGALLGGFTGEERQSSVRLKA